LTDHLEAQFQSTHPRGVRLYGGGDARAIVKEFQSTHPRGVRLVGVLVKMERICLFQSTHPRGVRRCGSPGRQRDCIVSIHAPARGATFMPPVWLAMAAVSIHAPARGATYGGGDARAIVKEFQSTHPRGVRRASADGLHMVSAGFNPRTRAGCDKCVLRLPGCFYRVSIHAPARGATPVTIIGTSKKFCFNPRTRAGCDQ